jgi:transposase
MDANKHGTDWQPRIGVAHTHTHTQAQTLSGYTWNSLCDDWPATTMSEDRGLVSVMACVAVCPSGEAMLASTTVAGSCMKERERERKRKRKRKRKRNRKRNRKRKRRRESKREREGERVNRLQTSGAQY